MPTPTPERDILEELALAPDRLAKQALDTIKALREELVSATRHMEMAEAAWLRATSGNPPCQDSSQKNLTLTDAEREAVRYYIGTGGPDRVDATLRGLLERFRKTHDAVPAAIASVDSVVPQPTTRGDSDRTDKAAPRPSEGTGDTPVTEPMPAFVSGSGSVTPVSYAKSDEKRVDWPADRGATEPRNGAVDTPKTQTTPGECSRPQEGTFRVSRNAKATLTDAEREAIKWAVSAARNAEHPAEDTLCGLLERTGGN